MPPTITWLLTSTTYGTWLPGDKRGFVSTVRDYRPGDEAAQDAASRIRHAAPGTEYDRDASGLHHSAMQAMKGDPVWLTNDQAKAIQNQFLETARYRGWEMHAVAVMNNHFHIVVTASESVRTDQLLRDFKSYASRVLNSRWSRPASGTWWTESGSRRRLPDSRAVEAAVRYVLNQYRPLALWSTGTQDRVDTQGADATRSEV